MRRWYTEVGTKWLRKRIRPWAARLGEESVAVKVRDLGFRWGSARPQAGPQRVNIHWATLQLPPRPHRLRPSPRTRPPARTQPHPRVLVHRRPAHARLPDPQDHPRRHRQAHLAWRRPLTVRAGKRGRLVFGSARRPTNGCRSKSIRPLPATGRDRAPDRAGVSARDARSGSGGSGDAACDLLRQPEPAVCYVPLGVVRTPR